MNPAENYILNQTEPFRSILLHVQMIIEQTITDVELKYKYKIPFYYVHGRPFCYLNKSKNYVDIGFWNAAHLTIHTELMISAGRKVIKSLRYTTLEEIQDTILKEVLGNAYRVQNEKFWK